MQEILDENKTISITPKMDEYSLTPLLELSMGPELESEKRHKLSQVVPIEIEEPKVTSR